VAHAAWNARRRTDLSQPSAPCPSAFWSWSSPTPRPAGWAC